MSGARFGGCARKEIRNRDVRASPNEKPRQRSRLSIPPACEHLTRQPYISVDQLLRLTHRLDVESSRPVFAEELCVLVEEKNRPCW